MTKSVSSGNDRRAFFFPHPLVPEQKRGALNLPGRVPYLVKGALLGPDGPSDGTCLVMADGFWDETTSPPSGVVGSNQDPCVFSAPWGPFHSFCRIDGANAANERVIVGDAVGAASLPEAVRPNDVIIYGKTEPKSRRSLAGGKLAEVWIDTVLVVDEVVEAPLGEPVEGRGQARPFAWSADPSFPGKGTDAYRFNLSDGDAGGMHATTSRSPHRIIKGKVSHAKDALTKLATSFVPLADIAAGMAHVCVVDKGHLGKDWPALAEFFENRVYGNVSGTPKGGWIAQFDSFALAEALIAAVVKRSGGHQRLRGTVAIPPLSPQGPVKRWDPKTSRAR